MGIRFYSVLGTAAVAIATALPAAAQQASDNEIRTIPGGFEDLFFNYSGNFFDSQTIQNKTGFFIGTRFPEQEIAWDANAVHQAYIVHLTLQNRSGPLLRVPDLPNAFDASLLTSPGFVQSSNTGSDFIYEFTPAP